MSNKNANALYLVEFLHFAGIIGCCLLLATYTLNILYYFQDILTGDHSTSVVDPTNWLAIALNLFGLLFSIVSNSTNLITVLTELLGRDYDRIKVFLMFSERVFFTLLVHERSILHFVSSKRPGRTNLMVL